VQVVQAKDNRIIKFLLNLTVVGFLPDYPKKLTIYIPKLFMYIPIKFLHKIKFYLLLSIGLLSGLSVQATRTFSWFMEMAEEEEKKETEEDKKIRSAVLNNNKEYVLVIGKIGSGAGDLITKLLNNLEKKSSPGKSTTEKPFLQIAIGKNSKKTWHVKYHTDTEDEKGYNYMETPIFGSRDESLVATLQIHKAIKQLKEKKKKLKAILFVGRDFPGDIRSYVPWCKNIFKIPENFTRIIFIDTTFQARSILHGGGVMVILLDGNFRPLKRGEPNI